VKARGSRPRPTPPDLQRSTDESRFCPTCGSPWLFKLRECVHGRHQMPALVLLRVGRRSMWVPLDRLLKGVA
jgi:hypothetical protein